MWAHHPAALCSWTVMHSKEKTISLSLRHLLVFTTSQNQRSLHRMCTSCCVILKCSWEISSTVSHMMFQDVAVKSSSHKQSKSHSFCSLPKDDLYLNPYLDWRLHVEFSIGDDSLLVLVSRRQRSWMLLLSEIPEQGNMQNFPRWVLLFHAQTCSLN